ncbi:NB-ARC domain, LRR domain containing protein [Parasponia andersonii]|uniref:NB-ARC domain, LRR domain containing protein n=1 Tax=Parasponia andersonii TaxID=3476 RepID=A0A2P5D5R9_PARAD|nr:NB-ARC domain, LRR domain containing protein [Parasponia andersonii]
MRQQKKHGRFIRAFRLRFNVAYRIRNTKVSLRDIKDRGERNGLRPLEQGTSSRTTRDVEGHDPRLGSLFIEEDELVGIDSTSEEIMRRLLEGTSTRTVISLVGTGGIGKTTLAKHVYDNGAVEGHFDYRTWVTVSQTCNLKKRLIVMAKHICPDFGEITTMEEVISLLKRIDTYRRRGISIRARAELDSLELKQLSLETVKRCQGLPLVTTAIAGLLSTKEKVVNEKKQRFQEKSNRLSIYNSTENVLEIKHAVRSIYLFDIDVWTDSFMTMDLTKTPVQELPVEINKLRNLHHLIALYWNPMELQKLSQLKCLEISRLTAQFGKALCGSIEKMNNLKNLTVYSITKDEILDLQNISSSPHLLKHLELAGSFIVKARWATTMVDFDSSMTDGALGQAYQLHRVVVTADKASPLYVRKGKRTEENEREGVSVGL